MHNGTGLKKGLLSQLANYLGTKFSNPNLLINPDFKINQRGKSTYSSTGTVATVDRWLSINANTIVNSDNTVTVTSLSGKGYYTQREENVSHGKHTYSIYVQAITGTVKAIYNNKDKNDIELGTLKQGLNTFTSSDDGFRIFFLEISSESSVTLKYAKVEQGSVATAFIPPNPVEEYPKCQRYFQYIPMLYCVPLAYTRDLVAGPGKSFQVTNGNLPTEMRTKPTLTYKTLSQSDNSTFAYSASFEFDSKSINTVIIDRTISNFTIMVNNINLDAEIY